MREQRHWGDFRNTLQLDFPETELITLDIPGNGTLYQSLSPDSIAGMTEALRQQLTPQQKARPFNLIALSMGGMIALDWMTRYPAEITAGILINTSIKPYAPFYQRLRWQNYRVMLNMAWQTRAQREQTILALTSNMQRDNASLLLDWQCWQQECPVTGRNAFRQLWACATFKLRVKPAQPILILASTGDRLVDYRCSLKLQQAWQSSFAQHPTAGHDLPLDDPLWTSRVIQAWLTKGLNTLDVYPKSKT